jgi:hypothetical protein
MFALRVISTSPSYQRSVGNLQPTLGMGLIDEFSEYPLDIRYRKGSEAVIPDAISRRPVTALKVFLSFAAARYLGHKP